VQSSLHPYDLSVDCFSGIPRHYAHSTAIAKGSTNAAKICKPGDPISKIRPQRGQ
jgi:hypothetical protein